MGRLLLVTTLAIAALLPATSMAHGGGIDRNGGHRNRRTGMYHCHHAPCFEIQRGRAAREAAEQAEREQRRQAQEARRQRGSGMR
ncbi:MAG: YHYH domain-containing protein [Sandaracinaceae bacterium]|nr:YHYH domain-containing protein [Sandaracinaceae bacterium]